MNAQLVLAQLALELAQACIDRDQARAQLEIAKARIAELEQIVPEPVKNGRKVSAKTAS